MSFINDKTKEINCKIIYFGPPKSGKTTSLRHIYKNVSKSEALDISISKEDHDSLYFDFVPLNLGKINDYTVRMHLYTFPGETGYKQSRALISKGIDGIVFIADSQIQKMEGNLKSLSNLKEIVKHEGHDWGELPHVYQYNKRDLPDALAVPKLREFLNKEGVPDFETIASRGSGIIEAFHSITKKVLSDLK